MIGCVEGRWSGGIVDTCGVIIVRTYPGLNIGNKSIYTYS